MSEKLLKCTTIDVAPLQKFKSDQNLTNYKTINEKDIENFLTTVSVTKTSNLLDFREKGLDMWNNTASIDLGISIIKESSRTDLSICTNKIVNNALHIPRCLYCPFCAAEYMFEFSLKDHLKKIHLNEIMEISSKEKNLNEIYETHTCPFCSAIFYHYALVPLHLGQHHEPELLKQWQQSIGNMNKLSSKKRECPSIELVACSPAMSDLLQSLDISGRKGGVTNDLDSPKLKSILKKKTSMSGKIIFSPSSASLRRIGKDVSKRNISARRELRFELPPEQFDYSLEPTDPLYRLRESPPHKSKWGCLFTNCKTNKKKSIVSQKNKSVQCPSKAKNQITPQMITSTPISFLSNDSASFSLEKKSKWRLAFKRDTKMQAKSKDGFLPSFYASERFMCALCKLKFQDNSELLRHLREVHNRFTGLIRSRFKCGQCGKEFYKNNQLVRHCYNKHTPQKHRTSL